MKPEDANRLYPGVKVVIKNDFHMFPNDYLRRFLGKEVTVRNISRAGNTVFVSIEEEPLYSFFIEEVSHIVGEITDCGDTEYQTVDLAELFA